MTEEVRITYKRKPGAGPNHPPEDTELPADAYIAPCNNLWRVVPGERPVKDSQSHLPARRSQDFSVDPEG